MVTSANQWFKSTLVQLRQKSSKFLSWFLILSDDGIWVRGPQFGLLDKLLSKNGMVSPGARALAVWYPLNPIGALNWFSPRATLMSQFPRGRLGNRILELSLGMHTAQDLGFDKFVMVSKRCVADEEIFCQILELSGVIGAVQEGKASARLKGSLKGARHSRVIQIDFLDLAEAVGLAQKDYLRQALSTLRSRLPSDWQEPVGNDSPPKVVLHFRSTDRLTEAQDKEYRPPPLAYFRKAVQIEGCRKILLLTDDPESGLVESLVQQIKHDGVNVTVQKNPLARDFQLMATCETLILPSSSLSDSAAGLNKNLKRMYVFGGRRTIRNDVEVVELWDSSGHWEKEYLSLGNEFETKIGKLMKEIRIDSITHKRNSPTTLA